MKTPANIHEGTVVSVAGDKLTTTSGDGKQHTHTMAKDSTITHDGQPGKAKDLKAGTAVRVTTHKDDKAVATRVESGKDIMPAAKKA
jgi:class 3 adenylate cyclase